jgi:signal transduction histidine kinase
LAKLLLETALRDENAKWQYSAESAPSVMMSRSAFETRLKIGFLTVAIILAATVALAYRNSRQFRALSEDSARVQEMLRSEEAILATMVDAETGMRGYAITGDPIYLEPYNEARERIGRHLTALKALRERDGGGAIPADEIKTLEKLIADQFDFREKVIQKIRAEGLEKANIRLDEGKGGLDQIRRIIASWSLAEEGALANKRAAFETSDRRWLRTLAALAGAILLLLVGGLALVRHHLIERRKSEQQLAKMGEEARLRSIQLEGVNQELEAFSYSVSHDLRAPLRHVAGFADMLQRHIGPQLDAKGQRYVQTIIDAAKRMGMLIDDLLVFSRMGRVEMKREAVDLNTMVDGVIEELRQEIGARPVIWRKEKLPAVQADKSMLRQVVVNLLSNAVKYTGPRDPAEIEIGARDEKGEILVWVKDNGVGFDSAYAHKLFGVFQRLHQASEFEGTGIGLANVRRIVTRHGGRVWAEGSIDKGATFHFSLPKSPEPNP